MGLISKAFSDIITFSRSSNATRVGPDGTVQYAPHNLLTYSAQFENAAWTKSASSVSSNVVAAPDGTVTADKVIEAASSLDHAVYQTPTVSAVTYTLSVYAKAAERTQVLLDFSGGTNFGAFNLTAGTVVSTAGTGLTASIQNVGNGWYRCSITQPQSAGTLYPSVGPAVAGARVYAGDGTSGVYIWGAQFSQGSIAGDYTPTTSAAVYGPRFDYDPQTYAAKGLLIEEQRTNLVTYSEQFDNANWVKYNATITANAAISPDGTTTADLLAENTATDVHVMYQSVGVTSGTAYAWSGHLKAAGRNIVKLTCQATAVIYAVEFNLSTGTSTNISGSGTATITAMGNGWYRITASATASGSGTGFWQLDLGSAPNTYSYTGNGSSGVYVWGAQLEAGAFATSYIPTIASSVTRSADVASVNTLSPWFNATEGTLFVEASNVKGVYPHLAGLETDANNAIWSYAQEASSTTRYGNLDAVSGGTLSVSINTAAAAVTTIKQAAAYKANDFAVCVNAGTIVSDTSATVPSVTKLQIGTRTATQYWLNGYIRRLAYYPRRLTNAELQALTA